MAKKVFSDKDWCSIGGSPPWPNRGGWERRRTLQASEVREKNQRASQVLQGVQQRKVALAAQGVYQLLRDLVLAVLLQERPVRKRNLRSRKN